MCDSPGLGGPHPASGRSQFSWTHCPRGPLSLPSSRRQRIWGKSAPWRDPWGSLEPQLSARPPALPGYGKPSSVPKTRILSHSGYCQNCPWADPAPTGGQAPCFGSCSRQTAGPGQQCPFSGVPELPDWLPHTYSCQEGTQTPASPARPHLCPRSGSARQREGVGGQSHREVAPLCSRERIREAQVREPGSLPTCSLPAGGSGWFGRARCRPCSLAAPSQPQQPAGECRGPCPACQESWSQGGPDVLGSGVWGAEADSPRQADRHTLPLMDTPQRSPQRALAELGPHFSSLIQP